MRATRYIAPIFLLVGVFFAVPVHAATVETQTVGTEIFDNNVETSSVRQPFGIGLNIDNWVFRTFVEMASGQNYSPSANGQDGKFSFFLYECTGANGHNLSSCSQVASGNTNSTVSTTTFNQFQSIEFSWSYSSNPSRWYWIEYCPKNTFGNSCAGGDFRSLGSNSTTSISVISGITAPTSTVDMFGGDDPTNVRQSYFFLSDGAGSSNSITSIISPLNQSVTESVLVDFSFNYYVVSLYDRAGFILKDQTSGRIINVTNSSSTINSSGSGTYQQIYELESGHLYEWQPVLYDTSGVLSSIYGTKQVFYVETTSGYQSLVYSRATSSNPFSNGQYASSSWVDITGGSSTALGHVTIATTSLLMRCGLGSMPDNVSLALQTHFPFSYVCDFGRLVSELLNGDGSSMGDVVAHVPNSRSSSTYVSVTLVDKGTVAGLPQIQLLKEWIGYAIYLGTAFGIMTVVLSVF